jgi:hypothetical protein
MKMKKRRKRKRKKREVVLKILKMISYRNLTN